MKPEHEKIYHANIEDFGLLSPAQLMGLTLWAEARGESLAGKIAVATVIINRVNHRAWDGSTIHEVCLWPMQFSCFNPDDRQRPRMAAFAADMDAAIEKDDRLKDCVILADGIIRGIAQMDSNILMSRCCQYLTTAAKENVNWWKKMRFIKKIGEHQFYSDLRGDDDFEDNRGRDHDIHGSSYNRLGS